MTEQGVWELSGGWDQRSSFPFYLMSLILMYLRILPIRSWKHHQSQATWPQGGVVRPGTPCQTWCVLLICRGESNNAQRISISLAYLTIKGERYPVLYHNVCLWCESVLSEGGCKVAPDVSSSIWIRPWPCHQNVPWLIQKVSFLDLRISQIQQCISPYPGPKTSP